MTGPDREERASGEAANEFVRAAIHAGGAAKLRWRVIASRKGRINRVTYRADGHAAPGWFAYLREPASESRAPG